MQSQINNRQFSSQPMGTWVKQCISWILVIPSKLASSALVICPISRMPSWINRRLFCDRHPIKVVYLMTLGNSQLARFEHLDDLSDLENAISNQQKTVELTNDGHPNQWYISWALVFPIYITLSTLATYLISRMPSHIIRRQLNSRMIDTPTSWCISQNLVFSRKLALSTSVTCLILRMPSQIHERQSYSLTMDTHGKQYSCWDLALAWKIVSTILVIWTILQVVFCPTPQPHNWSLHTHPMLSKPPNNGFRYHIAMVTFCVLWMVIEQP